MRVCVEQRDKIVAKDAKDFATKVKKEQLHTQNMFCYLRDGKEPKAQHFNLMQVRHVTNTNESCHTYEEVRSRRTCEVNGPCHGTRVIESCALHDSHVNGSCCSYARIESRVWIRHMRWLRLVGSLKL